MAAKQEQQISVWVVTLSDVNDGENWTRVYRTEKGAKLAIRGEMISMLKEEGLFTDDMKQDDSKMHLAWGHMTRGDWSFTIEEVPLLD
jgi:hypothetical protein